MRCQILMVISRMFIIAMSKALLSSMILACLLTGNYADVAGSAAVDNMAVLARHSAKFDVLQVQFDPITGKHLATAGLRVVQVATLTEHLLTVCI